MNRDRLGSRLGFILLSAGCAIGCGNVWKFPWLTGQFGGGAFVLIYLFFLVILGWPVMTMEFALGRASQKSPVHMYQVLEPAGTKWHWHGIAALIGNVVLMMFYMVVTGWMLQYFFYTATGEFSGKLRFKWPKGSELYLPTRPHRFSIRSLLPDRPFSSSPLVCAAVWNASRSG